MQLNDAVPSLQELEARFGADTDALCSEHERLIEQILEEEEELITGHRRHIDDVVDLVKQEMSLLNEVDKPGSDVESYVASLDRLLTEKMTMITQMRKKLIDFHTHLKTEEAMSKLYQQQQAAQDASVNPGDSNFADDLIMDNNNYDDGYF
jgi:kinesin family protein 2/24